MPLLLLLSHLLHPLIFSLPHFILSAVNIVLLLLLTLHFLLLSHFILAMFKGVPILLLLLFDISLLLLSAHFILPVHILVTTVELILTLLTICLLLLLTHILNTVHFNLPAHHFIVIIVALIYRIVLTCSSANVISPVIVYYLLVSLLKHIPVLPVISFKVTRRDTSVVACLLHLRSEHTHGISIYFCTSGIS